MLCSKGTICRGEDERSCSRQEDFWSAAEECWSVRLLLFKNKKPKQHSPPQTLPKTPPRLWLLSFAFKGSAAQLHFLCRSSWMVPKGFCSSISFKMPFGWCRVNAELRCWVHTLHFFALCCWWLKVGIPHEPCTSHQNQFLFRISPLFYSKHFGIKFSQCLASCRGTVVKTALKRLFLAGFNNKYTIKDGFASMRDQKEAQAPTRKS